MPDGEVGPAEVLAIWRASIILYEDGTPRTKHVITNPKRLDALMLAGDFGLGRGEVEIKLTDLDSVHRPFPHCRGGMR